MNVALCLSGLMRNWQEAYDPLKQYLLDPLQPDVFIYTWSEVGYYAGKGLYLPETSEGFVQLADHDRGFLNNGELIDAGNILQAYKPVRFHIEDFSRYESHFKDKAKFFQNAFTRPLNTVSQSFGINHVLGMVPNLYHYDVIVRMRPDLFLEGNPFEMIQNISRTSFYTNRARNKRGTGTGDAIQISTPGLMDKFGPNMWYHLEKYYGEQGNISCPHLFVQSCLKEIGAEHHELSIGSRVSHSRSGIPYTESV